MVFGRSCELRNAAAVTEAQVVFRPEISQLTLLDDTMLHTKIPDSLAQKIRAGECVLFLGAGATQDAGGPSGPQLAKLLADHFAVDIPTSDLQHFSDILVSQPEVDREAIDSKIIDIFHTLKPAPGHFSLPKLPWKAIFTTNYDRLIEKAYDSFDSHEDAITQQTLHKIIDSRNFAPLTNPLHVPLYKLHGCISHIKKRTPLILTTRDYEKKKNRNVMLRVLRNFAREHAILFVGYSFAEPTILKLLDDIEETSPYRSHRTMYLVTMSPKPAEVKFFESRRIAVVGKPFSEAFAELCSAIDQDAIRQMYIDRVSPVISTSGKRIKLPPKLRVSLSDQIDFLERDVAPRRSARNFLSGQLPTTADLKNRNDIERTQEQDLVKLIESKILEDEDMTPIVLVLGSGGAGKSTFTYRAAYNLVERNAVLACRLKSHELIKNRDILEFTRLADSPVIFLADGLEVPAQMRRVFSLRNDLSASRSQAIIVASCQTPVWEKHEQKHPRPNVTLFRLNERLTETEASDLIGRLQQHDMIQSQYEEEDAKRMLRIIDDCHGHLIVAMLELVKNSQFRLILIGEYQNLTERAREAYKYVSILHQHNLAIPDYLLNKVTTDDWDIFKQEVIQIESKMIILQDLNHTSQRLYFRTRHPIVARTIVDAVIPKHEDRIRLYRKLILNLGASQEDRAFLLDLLTSSSAMKDVRESKYIREFFDLALEFFPDDEVFILHLGKFQNQSKNLPEAHEILSWGRQVNPRNSHIMHQLGICQAMRAELEEDKGLRSALFQDAEDLYKEIQLVDPGSHYGYTAESKLHLRRARPKPQGEADDHLSAAFAAVERGLDMIRPDQLGALEEAEAELWSKAGDPKKVVARLSRLADDTKLRYAYSYHLLAAAFEKLGEISRAVNAIETGIDLYPGNLRLSGAVLRFMERRFFEPMMRNKFRELFIAKNVPSELEPHVVFLRGVKNFYDNQIEWSRSDFRELKQRLRLRASGKIRIKLSDPAGAAVQRTGSCFRRGGQVFIKDVGTGARILMTNPAKWNSLGKPRAVTYNTVFTFQGVRGQVLASPPADVTPDR